MEKEPFGSPPVALARQAIDEYVRHGDMIEPPGDLAKELLTTKAGAFVSLHRHGQLRGCIGTTAPTQSSLAREIIRNAIYAATEDPRFEPLEPEELDDLDISVDVLAPPEPVASEEELDPKRYGVIVKHGYRTGLLLPDLDGIDSVDEQVAIAKQKAGLALDDPCELFRFEVIRHH
jgi:AmmeMemoRadiSam system protein A